MLQDLARAFTRPIAAMRPVSPMRRRAKESAPRREVERRQYIAEVQTYRLNYRRVTQHDGQGRVYTLTLNSRATTAALIEQQIDAFLSEHGRYPAVLLLSPLRFLANGFQITYYILPQFCIRIPVKFERATYEQFRFDVMARGA